MLENYSHFLAGHALEDTLHRAAIFTCTHSIEHTDNLEFSNSRAENLECAWGIVFLVYNLKLVKNDLEKWWQYATANKKRVYLCMVRGSASDVNTDGNFLFIFSFVNYANPFMQTCLPKLSPKL